MPPIKRVKSSGDALAALFDAACDDLGVKPLQIMQAIVNHFSHEGSNSKVKVQRNQELNVKIAFCDIYGKAGEVSESALYPPMDAIADKMRMDFFAQCDFWFDICQCKGGVCYFFHPKGTQEWKRSIMTEMPNHKGRFTFIKY